VADGIAEPLADRTVLAPVDRDDAPVACSSNRKVSLRPSIANFVAL